MESVTLNKPEAAADSIDDFIDPRLRGQISENAHRLVFYNSAYRHIVGATVERQWQQGEQESARQATAALAQEVFSGVFDVPVGYFSDAKNLRSVIQQFNHPTEELTDLVGAYKRTGVNLGYQEHKSFGPDNVEDGFSDFLHFGVPKPLSEELVAPLRVYVDAPTAQAGQIAARVVREFREREEPAPQGKIWDCSSDEVVADRSDGLVFWCYTPDEASAVISTLRNVVADEPSLFDGKKADGSVFGIDCGDGIKLSQEPLNGKKLSFNQQRAQLLSAFIDRNGTDLIETDEFWQVLRKSAKNMGISQDDINLSLGQDPEVVYAILS